MVTRDFVLLEFKYQSSRTRGWVLRGPRCPRGNDFYEILFIKYPKWPPSLVNMVGRDPRPVPIPCIHCNQEPAEHVGGQCLFGSSSYEPMRPPKEYDSWPTT